MTDVQQQAKNSTAATLARLERLSGRFPVLSSENRQHYEELLICLLEHYRPRNFLGERLIKYLADEEWETSRYKRHKILLIERRFRARLAFQAYREEAAKEIKRRWQTSSLNTGGSSSCPRRRSKASWPRLTPCCCARQRSSSTPVPSKSPASISRTRPAAQRCHCAPQCHSR
jgi:hypothetical protein